MIHDPQTAADLGIGMVHQHFSLVESLTVWENVLLGDHARLDRRRARQQVAETAEHYGLGIDPDRRVGDLSAGLRQRVELIKCLRRDPAIVILDEPTSVLTPAESEQLFTTLREVDRPRATGGGAREPQARRGAARDRRDHDHAPRPGGRPAPHGRRFRRRTGPRDGGPRGVAAHQCRRTRSDHADRDRRADAPDADSPAVDPPAVDRLRRPYGSGSTADRRC